MSQVSLKAERWQDETGLLRQLPWKQSTKVNREEGWRQGAKSGAAGTVQAEGHGPELAVEVEKGSRTCLPGAY